jgi:TonB family protein
MTTGRTKTAIIIGLDKVRLKGPSLNQFLRLISATACGVLIFTLPASAKMSSISEEHYIETVQAARALEKSKDWAKARAKYVEAREEAVKGQDKKKEVKALAGCGNTYFEMADYPAAEASFREALACADASGSAGTNPDVGEGLLASCLYDLSNVLIKEKRDTEAKPYFARCMEITRRVFSANHPELAVRTGEYAALLIRLGDQAEGAELANQSQKIVNIFMGDMCAKIKKAWQPPPENFSYRLGVQYDVVNHGKVTKVEVIQSSGSPTADQAGIAAVKAGAPFGDITSTDLDNKITLNFNFDYNFRHKAGSASSASQAGAHKTASRQAKDVQAESEAKLKDEKIKSSQIKEQIDSLLKSDPDDATGLADLYVQYAESLRVQGEPDEAISLLKDAMTKDCFRDHDNPGAVSMLIALGHLYVRSPGVSDAEPILKKAIAASAFAKTPLKLKQEALEDYGTCLSKNHKFAEAQDYYNRASELKE